MTKMLERAARAVFSHEWGDAGDEKEFASSRDYWTDCARAVLMAVRDPDDAFMLDLYPDPKIETADRGRGAGARSRRTGRMQIAHFIDAILNGDA